MKENDQPKSRRWRLGAFVMSGRLRQALEGKLDDDAIDLLVDVASRYCLSGKRRRLSGVCSDDRVYP